MAWQVLITDEALDDLRRIVDFIAQDDPDAAELMGQRLIRRSLELATMPERNPIHDTAHGIPQILRSALSHILPVQYPTPYRAHSALLALSSAETTLQLNGSSRQASAPFQATGIRQKGL
jgi:plasmid stabilization system protein ParE